LSVTIEAPRGENNPAFVHERKAYTAHVARYKEHSERRVRIAPCHARSANPVSPSGERRGSDVHRVISARVSTRVPDRCVTTATGGSALLPFPQLRVNRINPVYGRGGRRGRTSIRTNLSVTVISRRMLALGPR